MNPIFHHWRGGDGKFGLTFQSPADAAAFETRVQAALDELARGGGRQGRGGGGISLPGYPWGGIQGVGSGCSSMVGYPGVDLGGWWDIWDMR